MFKPKNQLNSPFNLKIEIKMKKIILSMLVAGSLLATSCKGTKKDVTDLKNATVEAADKAAAATKDAANKVVDGTKEVVGDAVDATKDGVNAVKDGAEKMIYGVKIPEFSNPAVTKNLTDYANYAKDYIDAKGNLGKISAMASKGQELAKKGAELIPTLSADDQAKYSKALTAIMSKMAPSNK